MFFLNLNYNLHVYTPVILPICEISVWHIPSLCVQWKTPDDGQRYCPKHVELHSKNKFEKLVPLVGFITRICHDARPPKRHISFIMSIALSVRMQQFVSHCTYFREIFVFSWNFLILVKFSYFGEIFLFALNFHIFVKCSYFRDFFFIKSA